MRPWMRLDGGVFGELWSVEIRNRILTVAAVLNVLVLGYALVLIGGDRKALRDRHPLVIKVDQNDRAYVIEDNAWNLDVRDKAPWKRKLFEQLFSTYIEKHFSHFRSTLKFDFSDSLYFLDQKLGDMELNAWKNDPEVKNFIQNASLPDVRAKAGMVTQYGLETGCRTVETPCEAVIDFEKITINPDGTVASSRKFRDTVRWLLSDDVKDDQLRVNAVGLYIVREDVAQAFQDEASR